jgi:hypothetical protein
MSGNPMSAFDPKRTLISRRMDEGTAVGSVPLTLGASAMSTRAFFERIRRKLHPDHLSFIGSGAAIALIWSELEAPLASSWVIYAIIGVLIALLLWRVATQWKVKSQEAENLRLTVMIVGILAGATVAFLFVRQ